MRISRERVVEGDVEVFHKTRQPRATVTPGALHELRHNAFQSGQVKPCLIFEDLFEWKAQDIDDFKVLDPRFLHVLHKLEANLGNADFIALDRSLAIFDESLEGRDRHLQML
jgi:hypothetical protein